MPLSAPSTPAENPFAEDSPLHPVFDMLVSREPLPPLVAPGKPWSTDAAQTLQTLQKQAAAPDTVLAALHLMNDDLDAAHVLVQNDPSPTGSYLHYLVHRREGDWSNTRYWAARTGKHPFFAHLSQTFGTKTWDARALVGDMEEAARLPHSAEYQAACAFSARETAEAVLWCAGEQAIQ